MSAEEKDVLLTVLGTVITATVSGLGTLVMYWINKHIKDEKVKAWVSSLSKIVFNAVQSVQQTYVDSIKGTGAWTAEAQKTALNKALTVAESELSDDMKTWIKENFGDVEKYLTTLIEAQIQTLKK